MDRILKFVAIVAALTALSISADLAQISGGGTSSSRTSPAAGIIYAKPTKAGLALTTKYGTASGTYAQTDTSLGVDFTDTANESTNLQGSLMAYPSGAFTYTAQFSVMPTCDLSVAIGPAQSASGASQILTQHCTGSFNNGSIDIEDWDSATACNATCIVADTERQTTGTEYVYLRYKDDGTNIYYLASGDGVNWRLVYSVAKASGFMAGKYNDFGVILAFYSNVASTTYPAGALMVGQSMTTP